MDSEDEHEYARFEDEVYGRAEYFNVKIDCPLTLYQYEIRQARQTCYDEGLPLWTWARVEDDERKPFPSYLDHSSFWRLRRFFETFMGFYEGSLDLSGRHERRYKSLKARMKTFLRDVDKLRPHTTALCTQGGDSSTPNCLLGDDEHCITPRAALWEFQQKYKLNTVLVKQLIDCADTVKEIILSNRAPQFQRVHLMDLPSETLHQVVELADPDSVRSLGATCSILRDISAAYRFSWRTLSVDRDETVHGRDHVQNPFSITNKNGDDVSTRWNARAMRDKFLVDCNFLVSRPDILQYTRRLHVHSWWNEYRLKATGLSGRHRNQFFTSIWRSIEHVLSHATTVTDLRLQSIHITTKMIHALSSMHQLHTVHLDDCTLRSVPESWQNVPRLPSVVNVGLTTLGYTYPTVLELLVLFPRLRVLFVDTGSGCEFNLPPNATLSHCNPFRTAERVHLVSLNRGSMPVVSQWVRDAVLENKGALPLQRLTIRAGQGIRQQGVLELVSAFEGATAVEQLDLRGVGYAAPALFGAIAAAFPHVRELAVASYASQRQRFAERDGCVRWPGALWEYAQRFAGFSQLEAFAWNYDHGIDCDYATTLGDSWLASEGACENADSLRQGAEEPPVVPCRWQGMQPDPEDQEGRLLEGLFAAYCPTLKGHPPQPIPVADFGCGPSTQLSIWQEIPWFIPDNHGG